MLVERLLINLAIYFADNIPVFEIWEHFLKSGCDELAHCKTGKRNSMLAPIKDCMYISNQRIN